MDILCIGSLNMDLTTYVDDFPLTGQTILGHSFLMDTGGKGANQAIACKLAGSKVEMYGNVGKDSNGNSLIESLLEHGVISKIIAKNNTFTGNATIIVNKLGQNRIIVVPGANYECSIEEVKEVIKKSSSKYVIFQLEIPPLVVEEGIKFAKSLGKITILNPAPAIKLNDDVFEFIDFFTPNETEFGFYINKKLESIEEIFASSKVLLDKGLKNLIVTVGEKGALYINKDESILIPSRKVKAIDTVAAGDCFNGYFISSLSKGFQIEEAIKIANVASSIAVTRVGAIESIPNIEEVMNAINKEKIL